MGTMWPAASTATKVIPPPLLTCPATWEFTNQSTNWEFTNADYQRTRERGIYKVGRQKASNYRGRNDSNTQHSYLPTPFGRVGPLLSPEIVTDEVLLPTVHHYPPLVVQHCCRGILEVMYPITNQLQQRNGLSSKAYPKCLLELFKISESCIRTS